MDVVEAETLLEAASACRSSFVACLEVPTLMKDEWAENRLADFNLWANGLGALVVGKKSLDSRLALRPQAKSILMKLLRLLKSLMDNCRELGTSDFPPTARSSSPASDSPRGRAASVSSDDDDHARSFSPWSDESQESEADAPETAGDDSVLFRAKDEARSVLGQLGRIAITIRRSGTRARLQKVDKLFPLMDDEGPPHPNDDADVLQDLRNLKAHLTTLLLPPPMFSGDPGGKAKELSDIQVRLVKCNLIRRHRFLCAQKHNLHLIPATGAAAKRQLDLEEKRLGKTGSSAPAEGTGAPDQGGEVAKGVQEPTAGTETAASALSTSFTLPEGPAAQAATTLISTTAAKLAYPKAPAVGEEKDFFKCPCCCQTLPILMVDGSRWRKHLSVDLCPYTCVLDNCSVPEVLYTSKAEWKQHMLQSHSSAEYWVCFTCTDAKQFGGEAAFATHLRGAHKETISEVEIDTLLEVCRRTVPAEISACPICPAAGQLEGAVDRDSLVDHISDCVHTFSLRALPWPPDVPDEDKRHMRTSLARTQFWLKHLLTGEDQAGGPGHQQGDEAPGSLSSYLELQEGASLEGTSGGGSATGSCSSTASNKRATGKRKKAEHYFQLPDNPYFAESSAESSSGNMARSTTSIEKALQTMRSSDGNCASWSDRDVEDRDPIDKEAFIEPVISPSDAGRETGRSLEQEFSSASEESPGGDDHSGDDDGRLQVIRPHAIEDAESERSRSYTREAAQLALMLSDLHDLNRSSESDESDLDEDESTKFHMKEREKRKIRRMTSGSTGKRNFAESIGSVSDREDMGAPLDTNEVISSTGDGGGRSAAAGRVEAGGREAQGIEARGSRLRWRQPPAHPPLITDQPSSVPKSLPEPVAADRLRDDKRVLYEDQVERIEEPRRLDRNGFGLSEELFEIVEEPPQKVEPEPESEKKEEDDIWGFGAYKKDKKKKGKPIIWESEPVKEPESELPQIVEPESESEKKEGGDWDPWGTKNYKKKKGKEGAAAAEPAKIPDPEPEPEPEKKEDDMWDVWGPSKKGKKKKGAKSADPEPVKDPEPEPEPIKEELESPKADDEDFWTSLTMKDKKKKDKAEAEPEPVDEKPKPQAVESELVDDVWSTAVTSKKDKKKKKGAPAEAVPIPMSSPELVAAESLHEDMRVSYEDQVEKIEEPRHLGYYRFGLSEKLFERVEEPRRSSPNVVTVERLRDSKLVTHDERAEVVERRDRLSRPLATAKHDGSLPPASPLLEAYHGTYQSMSPTPSPLLPARHGGGGGVVEVSNASSTGSDDERATTEVERRPKVGEPSPDCDGSLGKKKHDRDGSQGLGSSSAADVVDDFLARHRDVDDDNDSDDGGKSDDDAAPHAQTPPPVDDLPINVFDFLLSNATPNASNIVIAKPDSHKANVRRRKRSRSLTPPAWRPQLVDAGHHSPNMSPSAAVPQPSVLLESYHGTYQSISPMPSPQVLAQAGGIEVPNVSPIRSDDKHLSSDELASYEE